MHWLRLIANFASDEDCYSYDEKRELKRLLPDWDWNDPDRNGELFTHISETIHLFVDLDCKDEHAAQIQAFAGGVYGGEKVWRLAGESCSALVRRNPRWSVVGGSRRGV